MANNSLLAADATNPKASMLGRVDGAERSPFNHVVVNVKHTDITEADDTFILAQLPVGAAITRAIWIVTSAFSHVMDIGISTSAGAAGTEGNLDVLFDGSQQANTAVGVVLAGGEKASGKMCGLLTSTTYVSSLGHLCVTDSHVVISAATDLTSGEGTLVIEYIKTL